MISHSAKYFCCEDISLIENYEEARNSEGTWCCHHRKETDEGYERQELIDLDLYYNRPASELIFLSRAEHNRIHRKGKHITPEHRQHIIEGLIAWRERQAILHKKWEEEGKYW